MITLNSGREIELSSIRQFGTYNNLLIGVPRTRMNDDLIEHSRSTLAKEFGLTPVVIEPVRSQREVIQEPPVIQEVFGPQELLPHITCSALFRSSPVRKEPQDCSLVAILWFQNRWAMPIDITIINQIKKLDWEAVATNWTA